MLRTQFTRSDSSTTYYAPVMLGPQTVLNLATAPGTVREAHGLLGKLQPDDYSTYLTAFLANGLERFGDAWCYADICTVLLSAARVVEPKTYLEIGVRRGRSMAMVAHRAPDARLIGFDMWMPDYAGMPNPGPDFVRSELRSVGHRGPVELHSGDSHETVPAFFQREPDATVDIITVDGDHSEEGALADLRTVIPHLSVGGVLVFDDIVHPSHPYLLDIWRDAIAEDGGLVGAEFVEVGFGVALAVRVRPPSPRAAPRERAKTRIRSIRRALRRL